MAAIPNSVDGLSAHILQRLTRSAQERAGAWRTPVLSTVACDGAPAARTVVVRAVDTPARRLEIFTDSGSAKVAEILSDPRVALTFWDADAQEQLRLTGTAQRVTDTARVDARWHAIGPAGHALYGDGPATDRRARFAVLDVTWQTWDWLWIGGVPHRRARFTWSGTHDPESAWIDP